jgi:hypothetical protein
MRYNFFCSVGVDEDPDHAVLPGTPHRVINISGSIYSSLDIFHILLFGTQFLRLIDCIKKVCLCCLKLAYV